MKISILTTREYQQNIKSIVAKIERLDELVFIKTEKSELSNHQKYITVQDDLIKMEMDWHDTSPPYLFPDIQFSENNLLAYLFFMLENYERSISFLKPNEDLYNHILLNFHLKFGSPLDDNLKTFLQSNSLHNQCIIRHFGQSDDNISVSRLKQMYKDTMEQSKNNFEQEIFTAKYYLQLLTEESDFQEAIQLIDQLKKNKISEEANHTLNIALAKILTGQLTFPYDDAQLSKIANLLLDVIPFYEKTDLTVNAALLLLDIAEIENLRKDFELAKKYVDKALIYFKKEDLKELIGETLLQKARILHQWSKNNQPQYYKATIYTLQEALKIFNKNDYPQNFADTHHNLALLYAELPAASEEKILWSAFCASSFKEVLDFYTKKKYPYEYAMTCHNYATALLQFPEKKQQAYINKAKNFFEEALEIRTPEKHPFERALTLVNQLELFWLIHNEDDDLQKERFNTMQSKIKEIKTLTKDAVIIKKVNDQIEQLNKLKSVL